MPTYIDDQDFSKVTYNGTWVRGGSASELDGTVSSSTNVGDSLTVSFTGVEVSVFGTFDSTSGGVVTNYSIDGLPPVQVTSVAGATDTFKQQFWKSNLLEPGNHILTATMAKVNSNPDDPLEGTIWFDYFYITDPTVTSTVCLPSGTAVNFNSSNPNSNPNIRMGIIISAVLGALFFILGLVFLILFHRRNRKFVRVHELKEKESLHNSHGSNPRHSRNYSIEPFILTFPPAETSMAEFDPMRLVAPGQPALPSRKSTRTSASHAHENVLPPGAEPPSAPDVVPPVPPMLEIPHASGSTNPTRMQRPRGSGRAAADRNAPPLEPSSLHKRQPSHIRQHVDSGIRAQGDLAPGTPNTVELPPVYSPV